MTIADPTLIKGTVVSNFRSISNGGLENYTSQKTIVIQEMVKIAMPQKLGSR